MKKKLLIGLSSFYTLALIAVVAIVIYFWSYISAVNWSIVSPSNIRALYQGLTEAPEVTAEKKRQLDSERSNEIRAYVNMNLRDYTDEELKQIESGEKSETEILAQIITETVEENEKTEAVEGAKPEEVDGKEEKPNKDAETEKHDTKAETAEKIVARHVSSLYTIQGEFEGRVGSLASSVSNWTKAYKKAHPELTWRDAKVAAIQHFSGTASQVENECYARVDAQVEKLKSELAAIGADTSIVATIKSTAYAEMDARKAQIVQEGYAKLNK